MKVIKLNFITHKIAITARKIVFKTKQNVEDNKCKMDHLIYYYTYNMSGIRCNCQLRWKRTPLVLILN